MHCVAYGDYIWGTPPFILASDLTTEDFHTIELPDKSEATVVGRLWYDQENDKLDDVCFSPQQRSNINGTAIFL
ncbi:hypothetical protein SLA2020_052840 [Shorea laevis]